MAAALLASPSVHYDSPDSSFSSDTSDEPSSPSSPRLPALSSPFSVTQHSSSPGDESSETSAPTKSRDGSSPPGWVTEELEEEWVEEQSEDDDDQQASPSSGVSSGGGGSVRHSSTMGSIAARSQHSLDRTKPRVPSSLRYAYSPSSIPQRQQEDDLDAPEDNSVVLQPSPNSSSAGTFVVRSNPSSYKVGMGGENQLQAAVRALKGPSAGLGGRNEEEQEDTEAGPAPNKSPKKPSSDRLGLMSLFDPPSPPPALPPSTVTVPSSQAFTFAPPTTGPRSSWKSLPRFSPESNETTPIARPRGSTATPIGGDTMQLAMDETPSRPARQEAPAPKAKERYLHRSVTAAPHPPEASSALEKTYDTRDVTQRHEQTLIHSPQPDTPVPGTPSSRSQAPSTPQTGNTPALKLFSFQYDTFTRNHLAALVDEIDELGGSPPQASTGMGMLGAAREQVEEQRAWETSFVDVALPAPRQEDEEDDTEQQDGDSQDSILARGTRSTKRIRLSPRAALEQVDERERSIEWSASSRRSARRSSGGRHGGIRSALGNSAARRQARQSPTYTSTASAARSRHSIISASRSNYSRASFHPFARSLDQSGRLATPLSARSQAHSHHTPSPAHSHLGASKSSSTSTRDRLAEAHALLDRIRAKTAERDRRTASATVIAPASPSPAHSSRYPDTIELDSEDDDEEEGALPTPQKSRSATSRFIASNPSPRKLLRRLSASDEVDEELKEEGGAESPPEHSEEEQEQDDHRPSLPHLAAAASASLRSALEQSSASASPATPASAVGLGRQSDLASSRRHFARTPISAAAARRSRRSLEELFPNTTTSLLDSGADMDEQRKVSATSAISSSIASNSTTTAGNTIANSISTPGQGGHTRHRSLTTIGPNDVEALLASASAPSRMVFDREQNRWIKTTRNSVSLFGSSVAGTAVREEAGEEDDRSGSTEDDPFRDFESTRASGEIRADVSRLSSLTLKEARAEAVDAGLEGLGIMAGTPVVVVEQEKEKEQESKKQVSPDGACYFEMPPPEERKEEVEVVLEAEEEDTATWGEEEKARRERAIQDAEDDEESPLHLFRAAMRASQGATEDPRETVDGAEADDDETDLFPPSLDATGEQGIVSLATATVVASPSSSPARLVSLPLPTVSLPSSTFASPARLTSSPSTIGADIPATPRPPTTTSSSSNATPIALPRSALKPFSRSKSDPVAGTPQAQQISADLRVPRSVSFSDGKTSGKIQGLVVEREKERLEMGSRLKFEVSTKSSEESLGASVEGFEGEGEPGSLIMDESPDVGLPSAVSTRTKNIQDALEELQGAGPPSSATSPSSLVLSSFESAPPVRARADRSAHSNHSTSRTFRRTTHADATFLTECSFGVSADRLLQYITDVEPFEPDWEGLRSIDLRRKGAESVVRLKEFLPNLDEINLNDNEVAFLTGVPSTVRTLLLSSNRISSLTSFTHLGNLERIDISHNQIDSVHQLSCLRHLRELKADGNQISDLSGLGEIDGLLRLSVKGNRLESVDFTELKWARLETINLSRNKLTVITGVEHLQSATMLNFDHNSLSRFAPTAFMPRLRILRLCSNPIESLDIGFATKLRTLFIDGAKLGVVHGTDELRKLENLSVRDQSGAAFRTLAMSHIRDVKRLYLSGNPIPSTFPSEKFFNLVYLELAMCQLTSLPAKLASVVPNVRVLNLNFNFLEDLAPLEGLTRLSKLTIVGARLSKCRPVAAVLSSMSELEELDLRMNPFTLPFYPPFVSAPSALLPSHSEHQILHPDDADAPSASPAEWPAIDTKFRKSLPDEWYSKRATYRAVILQTVPSLLKLDGLLAVKERVKLAKVLPKLVRSSQ